MIVTGYIAALFIGTSLFIIVLNALAGVIADAGHYDTGWRLLLSISVVAIAGVFIVGLFGKRIEGAKLKKLFGWFVLTMGLYIIH